MNKITTYLFSILFIFFAQRLYGNIVWAERWDQVSEKETLSTKSIYLIADYHIEHETNRVQLKQLIRYLKKSTRVSLIVEDPSTFNNSKASWSAIAKSIKKNSLPLRGIASIAHHSGVLASSVEFRPCTFFGKDQTYVSDIINTTNEQVQRISEYDDNPILNEEYKGYVDKYKDKIVPIVSDLFKNIADQNCSIENINYNLLQYPLKTDDIFKVYEPPFDLDNYNLEQRVESVITCYAKEVIDYKILNALAEHALQGVESTAVYAGSGHINRLKRVLKKLGYRLSKYPTITYDENGEIQPLNVARAFEEMDPTYDASEVLPKETVDYFFEYKEAEENNPCFATRSAMKLFVAAADVLSRYKSWKQVYPRLDNLFKAMLSVGAASAAIWVLKVCCGPK